MEKIFYVSFDVYDITRERDICNGDCIEEVLAENEEQAIDILHDWIIEQSIQNGFEVEYEDEEIIRVVGGIDCNEETGELCEDQEYSNFRVVKKEE